MSCCFYICSSEKGLMKRLSALIVLALLCLVAAAPCSSAQTTSPRSADACESCHADFSSVLPKEHPTVKEKGLGACLQCHSTGQTGDAKKNGFSTRIHLTHGGPKLHMECGACHAYVPGKSFGLIGQSNSWGAPNDGDMAAIKQEFTSWANSSYTDHLHAKAMVDCAGCHGKEIPLPGSTVENSRCLVCHGPQEQLANKSAPKDFPERNPHRSHLDEIPCALCHHAHAAAKAYCLDCHRNFNMTIPGAGQ
jgi:predicted CXXCH cytochrome family protein